MTEQGQQEVAGHGRLRAGLSDGRPAGHRLVAGLIGRYGVAGALSAASRPNLAG